MLMARVAEDVGAAPTVSRGGAVYAAPPRYFWGKAAVDQSPTIDRRRDTTRTREATGTREAA
jgi:hypothetical protein